MTPHTKTSLVHVGHIEKDTALRVIVCFDEDGTPSSVFVRAKAKNKDADLGWCSVLGEMISMLLHAGVSVEEVCRHLNFHAFAPKGVSDLGHVSSVGQYLVRVFEKVAGRDGKG